ncbi:hypothetical protein N431DRAFT_477997 [Stipitochalara longipes BDJ]|nr:hypothetical protein N431DRAFT_477997 [Stipitochalara longipes BDJ]
MPNQQHFKTQTSRIPYEGPTRYEILHLIARCNAAHHDVDHINPAVPSDIDRAAVESLVTLDRERLFKHNPLDVELDTLIRDINQAKQISTEKDYKRIEWDRLMDGIKMLKQIKQTEKDAGFKGLVKHAGVKLEQHEVVAKEDPGKRLEKRTSNIELGKQAQRQIRKTQSHAEFGVKPEIRPGDDVARQDGVIKWMDTEVRKPDWMFGFSDCDFGLPNWIFPGCRHGGKLAKQCAKGSAPSTLPRLEAQGNGVRPATPGPSKLQKPNFNVQTPTKGTVYQVQGRLPVPQDPNWPQSPTHHHHHHTPNNQLQSSSSTQPSVDDHQQRPKSPGIQPPAKHQTRPKNPSPPQAPRANLQTPTKGTVYQPPVKTYVHSPTKHTVYQLPAKPPISNPAQDTIYPHPAKPNTPHLKSLASQQCTKSNTPGNLNRLKSNANLRPTAVVNDPTKDPGNKAMYNNRPRIATEVKEHRMQKAHDEAKRLASEIRKMD